MVRHVEHSSAEKLVGSGNKPSNMELFEIKPETMWFDAKASNNIYQNPGNNAIVLRFDSKFVQSETLNLLEIKHDELIKIPDPWKDPIAKYLRLKTFGKELLKEEVNQVVYDGIFSWMGNLFS